MTKVTKPYLFAALLAVLFLLMGIFTISDYGISWDAPFRMMRGQAYAHIYLTGELTYNLPQRTPPVLIKPDQIITRFIKSAWEGMDKAELPPRPLAQTEFKRIESQTKSKTSFYQSQDWNGQFMVNDNGGHLPLIDTLSAFSNRVFYQTLGMLGDIESYQLIYILGAAIGVFVVTIFTFQLTNSYFVSLIAGLSLGLFPLFLGDSHINMKDPIQASFYAGAIWGFWNWIRTNQLRWFVIFGIFIGLCLGVKWNLIFLPFILLPWLLIIRKSSELKKWFRVKKLLWSLALLGLSLLFFLILIWPNFWFNSINSFTSILGFYWDRGTSDIIQPQGFIGPLGFNFYPIVLLLTQTPRNHSIINNYQSLLWAQKLKKRSYKNLSFDYLMV
jgi:hypothetical protein